MGFDRFRHWNSSDAVEVNEDGTQIKALVHNLSGDGKIYVRVGGGFGLMASSTQDFTFIPIHRVALISSSEGVTVETDEEDEIIVHLPVESGSASLTVDVRGGAEGWIAREGRDPEEFVSDVTDAGGDRELLTFTFTANESVRAREATITISTTGFGASISRTLELTQAVAEDLETSAALLGVASSAEGLVLYPNPASDRLHIGGLRADALVRISTLGGLVAQSAAVTANSSSIDVGGLPRGAYIVVIESGEAVLSRRLVIIE